MKRSTSWATNQADEYQNFWFYCPTFWGDEL